MIRLNIEKILDEKNKSRYWLVKKLESSYPVVNSLIEGTSSAIKFETLEKLLFYLECTPEELIVYEREPPRRY